MAKNAKNKGGGIFSTIGLVIGLVCLVIGILIALGVKW